MSRNAERLEEATGKVRAIGRRAVAVAANVAADDAPERIVEAALELGGRIDVLVNNAGFMTFADPFNVNDETWDEIFNVNVRAPMRIRRAVLAEMVKACRGSIMSAVESKCITLGSNQNAPPWAVGFLSGFGYWLQG